MIVALMALATIPACPLFISPSCCNYSNRFPCRCFTGQDCRRLGCPIEPVPGSQLSLYDRKSCKPPRDGFFTSDTVASMSAERCTTSIVSSKASQDSALSCIARTSKEIPAHHSSQPSKRQKLSGNRMLSSCNIMGTFGLFFVRSML